MQGKFWCFTLHDYVAADLLRLRELGSSCAYLVFGYENCPETGRPHLQGYIEFETNKRLRAVKQLIGNDTVHLEKRKGSAEQAAEYCKKNDNLIEEFGSISHGKQGKRTDWERFQQWVDDLGRKPTERELCREFPSLVGRYGKGVDRIVAALCPAPILIVGDPREGWQYDLSRRVEEDASERSIEFIVDPEGNCGKTWMGRWLLSKYPERVQYLRPGKRDDMCHAIDDSKDVFVVDVPRSQMETLQYSVLEALKDRMIFSPKYESKCKILEKTPHVIVFCNEQPDRTKLSADRYVIYTI